MTRLDIPPDMREVADCPACPRTGLGLRYTKLQRENGVVFVVPHLRPGGRDGWCGGGEVRASAIRVVADTRPIPLRRQRFHRDGP